MSNTQAQEKAPNYTQAQIDQIKAAAPLDMEKAKKLGEAMGKSYRSIIAKAKREQIEYIAKEPEPKKGKDAPTKAQLVDAMREASGLKLTQLDKAPSATLNELAKFFDKVFTSEKTETTK